jgi:multidrug efflux pump
MPWRTSTAVRKRLAELKQQFPDRPRLSHRAGHEPLHAELDREVVHTFFEAVVLVVLVVFVFLQSLRATIIPILAVPISIVGTFVGMHLLGFSINMLTLFGMILAIGLVVDDAIVVVESVEANMAEKNLSPLEAAKITMTQIAGALISIVLVLVAVFLPVAFLGGVTGKLYQQFAVTIAISMVISGIMALTLSPALAAIILKGHRGEKNRFFRWFERGFEHLRTGYVGLVGRAIQGWPFALLAFAGIVAGVVFMFRIVPSSFVPNEDQGYFFAAIVSPDTANLELSRSSRSACRRSYPLIPPCRTWRRWPATA